LGVGSVNPSKVEFVLIAQDPDDNSWQVELRASNGRLAVEQEFYATREHFEPLVSGLRRFGETTSDEALLEFGEDSENWAYFIQLRAFIYFPTGNAALEIVAVNRSGDPYGQRANFFILTEVAALNRLGDELGRWLESPWNSFCWPESS
jgi:hypothetical protein